MQKIAGSFIADWKDALGRRHRRKFEVERDARRFEHRMIATSKLAIELGRRIARGSPGRGPTRAKEISRLTAKCGRIAFKAALGKSKPADLLKHALAA